MFIDIYEIVSASIRRKLSFVAPKEHENVSCSHQSDYALNTLVWIHHAVGLTRGHAFRSGIHECFEFHFALDFGLPVSA